jgi:Cytochrome C'
MKRLYGFVAIAVVLVSCGGTPEQAAAPAGSTPALTPTPHATLAQLMRGIPFPNSNIVFDTQSNDPGAEPKKGATDTSGGAKDVYSGVYAGWQQVENAALAMSETANLLMIPGRKCENGLPVPLDREDFRKGIQGLADAGQAAYKAAQTKNLDMMVEVSGTIADACAACHEVYRDKPAGKQRCVPN